MECHDLSTYAADGLIAGAVLALAGLAGLFYAIRAAHRAAVGDLLLEACDGDEQAAALAIRNVREEAELLRDVANYRDRVRRFHDEDAR